MYALAELAYKQGSYTDAAAMFNRILAQHPKDPKWLLPGTYVRLGQVYEAQKEKEAARRSYEKALDTEFIASDDKNFAKRALREIAQNKAS